MVNFGQAVLRALILYILRTHKESFTNPSPPRVKLFLLTFFADFDLVDARQLAL